MKFKVEVEIEGNELAEVLDRAVQSAVTVISRDPAFQSTLSQVAAALGLAPGGPRLHRVGRPPPGYGRGGPPNEGGAAPPAPPAPPTTPPPAGVSPGSN